jgi:hypothetical protein
MRAREPRKEADGEETEGGGLEQVLPWGSLFGDVALVTNSPYFNTATVLGERCGTACPGLIIALVTLYICVFSPSTEPTVALTISKSTLDEIYFENKTKLCEIRIKLAGRDVDLQHVIDHPRGCEVFRDFLTQVMAVENLNFYIAVDRFDSMSVTTSKLSGEIRKLRLKVEKVQTMIEARQSSKGTSFVLFLLYSNI